MKTLLGSNSLNPLSLGLGFLTGVLFWILFLRVRPRLMVAYRGITRWFSSFQLSAVFSGSGDIERLYRKQAHQMLQARHLFSDYFPLDEILISPKLVAPPPPMIPGEENTEPSLLHQTLSYTPGSPEFPTEYQAPSLTLVEALSTGLDICLMGKAGYGKTTALVEAALSILKGRTQFPALSGKLPFLIRAQHILAQFPNSNIQVILQKALAADLSSTTQTDFSSLLFSSLQSGNCLLLLDDLGSLPKNDLDRVVNFIRVLKIQYPSLQIAAAVSPDYIGRLYEISFIPIFLAGWDDSMTRLYLEKWAQAWARSQSVIEGLEPGDPVAGMDLWKMWLTLDPSYLTPLEFVLKVFGFSTNQIAGSSSLHAIQSYLRHATINFPETILDALEIAALYTLDQKRSVFSKRDINAWLKSAQQKNLLLVQEGKDSPFSRATQIGLEKGFLVEIRPLQYSFAYQTFTGWFASRGLSKIDRGEIKELFFHEPSLIHTEAFRYFPVHNPIKPLLPAAMGDPDPLKRNLAIAGAWLPFLPRNSSEREALLRALTQTINSSPYFFVKAHLVSMLAISGAPEISTILKHLLCSQKLNVRRAAALGCGVIQDQASVPQLSEQLSDQFPSHFAACYALGKIGSPAALEAVADALLHGDELLRRAAAEALSRHPSEGHPALREGSTMEDILVRYAVVHGLRNIPRPWAAEILDTMRLEDDQWVVRDAAQQAFENISAPSPFIPREFPEITDLPWLLEFAEQQGSSLAAGEAAEELLLQALREGSNDVRLAALEVIRHTGYHAGFPAIFDCISDQNQWVADNAEITLWMIAASGTPIPKPSSAPSQAHSHPR